MLQVVRQSVPLVKQETTVRAGPLDGERSFRCSQPLMFWLSGAGGLISAVSGASLEEAPLFV